MTRAIAPLDQMDRFLARVMLDEQEINDLVTEANTAIKSEAMMEGVTPYDTGVLSGTHFAHPAEGGMGEIGASAVYAAAVHANHPTKAGWIIDTINIHGRRIYGALLRRTLRAKGAR